MKINENNQPEELPAFKELDETFELGVNHAPLGSPQVITPLMEAKKLR